MKKYISIPGLLVCLLMAPGRMPGQTNAVPPPDFDRPVSWKQLVPNALSDQKKIWTSPAQLRKRKYLIPALAVLGVTAGLVALDSHDTAIFRNTNDLNRFNNIFSGPNTTYGMIAVPTILYATSFAIKDTKMRNTALLAGEAVADSEVVAIFLKDVTRRLRPRDVLPGHSYGHTWFDSGGSWVGGQGSFPSGHTIAAMSIATVVARRYRNHKWVPYVAYGLAGVVGFSRVSLGAHFISDVFMGGALGYSI